MKVNEIINEKQLQSPIIEKKLFWPDLGQKVAKMDQNTDFGDIFGDVLNFRKQDSYPTQLFRGLLRVVEDLEGVYLLLVY